MDKIFKVSQQTAWQLIGKAVTSITTFIFLGIVTRNYGESGTGTFTLALTYLAIFYLLADFGFNAHLLNSFHNLESNKQTIEWRKLLGTRLLWGSLLMLLSLLTLPFWPFSTLAFEVSVVFGSLAIIGSSVFISTNLVFQSKFRYDLSVISSTIGTMAGLILILAFSRLHLPIWYMLLGQTVSWIVISDIALLLVRKFIHSITPIFDWKYIGLLIKDSWPVAGTLALNVVYFRADAFILSAVKTSAEVGIYNVAYSIFQSILVIPTFIMNAYYPLMIESVTASQQKFWRQFRVAGLGLFGLSIAGVITTYFLAPFILGVLTGGGFSGSVTALRILILGFPAYFLSALLMWLLMVKKRYRTLLVIYGIGLVFNLVVNLIYIPVYSFIAASWSTVWSEYLILVLQILLLQYD